jgi:hypothetical protein
MNKNVNKLVVFFSWTNLMMRYQIVSIQHDLWDCRKFLIDSSHFWQAAAIIVYYSSISWRRSCMWYVQICCFWRYWWFFLGYINWKIALRKETTALFVLEVCFYVVHNLLKYLALHTTFTMKYSQCKSSIKMLWTKLYNISFIFN